MPYKDPQRRKAAARRNMAAMRARKRAEADVERPPAPAPADGLADWIEGLTIGQGDRAGQPFELLPWERQFLAGAFAPDVDAAALSIARGNGKSALVAAIAAAAIAGPLVARRGSCLVVASSFQQARIIFDHARDYLAPWIDAEPDRWRVHDSQSAARIADRDTGAVLRCIGSDPRRAHGEAPRLILADEPAQWPSNYSERMRAALETAKGKIPDARFIALGTRPVGGAGWFGAMLAGGPGLYAQMHAAPPGAALDDVDAWEAANPSMPHFPALRRAIEREAERAALDGGLVPAFRALRLNAGVADSAQQMLLDPETWARCESAALPPRSGPMVLGVDLGGASAMTAAAAYWPHSGRLEATAWFPALPNLAERGLADGVGDAYERLGAAGELMTMPGRTVPVWDVFRWVFDHWGRPVIVVGDRYKQSELSQAGDDASLLGGLTFRGQGFRDGAEDVRAFRRTVLDGKVTAPVSALIQSALSEAVTVSDSSGNQKLAKATEGGRRLRARDDVAAAMILTVAEGARMAAQPRPRLRWAVV